MSALLPGFLRLLENSPWAELTLVCTDGGGRIWLWQLQPQPLPSEPKFPLGSIGVRESGSGADYVNVLMNAPYLRAGLQKAQETPSGPFTFPKPGSQSLFQQKPRVRAPG